MSEKRILQILVGVFVLLVCLEIKGSWLMDPDESRYAEIPREMLATGDYVTPRLNGSHYFEKPPLLYWMNAAAMSIFGETPYAARLAARLAGMGTALLLIFLLPRARDSLEGWWAALIYLSAPLSFALTRVNIIDGLLTFGMTLTLLSMRGFAHASVRGEKTWKWEGGIGLGASLAVLSKGPVGIVLPGLIFVLWSVSVKKPQLIWKMIFSFATPIFFVLTSPWFVLMEKANPGFSNFFFIHEHLLRYATQEAKRSEPFYFFGLTFLWGFLFWLEPFGRALSSFFSKRSEIKSVPSDKLFFVVWFFCIVGFFSLSQSKLIPYLLPAFPAAAALSAMWIAEARGEKTIRFALASGSAVFYLALVFVLPSLAEKHSEHDLAVKALDLRSDQIVAYKTYPQSFPWVIKHPIPIVDFKGELASDGVLSPELFWNQTTFWARWNSDQKIVVCLPQNEAKNFNQTAQKPAFSLGKKSPLASVRKFQSVLGKCTMGAHMRSDFLPFSRPVIGDEEINEIIDSIRSGWITTGPKVEKFSKQFSDYVGGRYAAALSSATAGLHLALLGHDIGPGDEVITTPLTFAATVNVIILAGATPVLADIDKATLQIRVKEVEKKISKKTKAILPVHFAGQPVDLDPLLDLAKKHNLVIIEDAAHAAGTEYKGKKIGSFNTTSVFSFHPNKNMTTGEGGMVVTPSEEVFEKVSLLKFHGMDRNAWKRFDKSGSSRYDITLPGYKYNMMDIQAAMGLHQLPKLDGFIEARKKRALAYQTAFKNLAGLILPVEVNYAHRHAWHLYTPLVDIDRLNLTRDQFMTELKNRNIGSGLHYTAVHEFSYHAQKFGWKPLDFPEAHFVSERILSLPLFPTMTDKDQADVIETVTALCQEHQK